MTGAPGPWAQGEGPVLDAWSIPGALPGGTELAELEALPGGLRARRLVTHRDGALEIVRRLQGARERLVERPVRELVTALGRVAARLLEEGDPLREQALRLLPPSADLSAPMARALLDGMARDWTEGRLRRLLDAELGGGAVLDGYVRDRQGRRVRALGPPLTVHVVSGSVPGVSVTSLVRALLVKSAVLLKPGRGDLVLPLLFRRGLEEEDGELAAAAAVAYWPGGAGEALEAAVLERADLVVVYGDDEALAGVRSRARPRTPLVVYPHRVSFAVVGPTPSDPELEAAALAAARAVALFEQRGCVSPHLVYVLGARGEAERFAVALAEALEALGRELPAVPPDEALASRLHQLRGAAELDALAGRGKLWSGAGARWTVALEEGVEFRPSCLGRFVRVKAAASADAVVQAARPYRRHLQTVGVWGLGDSLLELAEGLARLGVVRVAPLESAPWPPPWWHHDGVGPLTALVRWTDLEEA